MFSLYNRRSVVMMKGSWADEDEGHDRFNRRCPSKNYDKFPKKIRPRKPQGCEVEEAEEQQKLQEPSPGGTPPPLSPSILTCAATAAATAELLGASAPTASPGSPNLGCTVAGRRFSCSFPFLSRNGTNHRDAPRNSIYELTATRAFASSSASALNRRGSLHNPSKNNVSLGKRLPPDMDTITSWFQKLKWRNRNGSQRDSTKSRRFSKANNNTRHYNRYDYTALEDEQSLQEKMELEKKVKRTIARGLGCFSLGGTKDAKHCTSRSESAFLTCQYYLKNTGRYILLEQLGDIGSRLDKFWFLVRDTTLKTERLLTMIPQSPFSPVQFSGSTKKMLMELFLSLQHPYIYPVLDVDVRMLAQEEYVMVILPFNIKGSLKDIIYKSRCQDEWQDKYHNPNAGLPIPQIQRLGRQILEALLFLQEKGFPPFGHLHSGNVIVQNGVSRLTGFENTLLGYNSRLYPTIKKKLKDGIEAMDVICFGHVMFEMCAGYEMSMAHPTARHFEEIQQYPEVVEVLSYIFEQEDGHYPTVKELTLIEFFRNMDLREMRSMPAPTVFQTRFSPMISNLLNDVRKHQTSHRYHEEFGCEKLKSGSEGDEVDDTYKSREDSGFNHAYSDGDGNDGDFDEDDTKAEIHSSSDDVISADYFEQSIIMTKRFRSSSLYENRFRQSGSMTEQKSAKLKKRRSNSASQMADCLETATTALLNCPSSDSSLAPSTSYASLADMHTHHTLTTTPSDEFHTPPNTPIVAKTIDGESVLSFNIAKSSQTTLAPEDYQLHVTINQSDISTDDPPV